MASFLAREIRSIERRSLLLLRMRTEGAAFSPTVVRRVFSSLLFLFLVLVHKWLLQNYVNILRENRIIDMCRYFLYMYNANTHFYS